MTIVLRKVILLIFILTTSCQPKFPEGWNWGLFEPRTFHGLGGFPSTETGYGQGFYDGCRIAFTTIGTGLLNDIDKTFDADRLTNDSEYSTGYWDAIEQCNYILHNGNI